MENEMKKLYVETPLLEIPAFNLPGKNIRFKMDSAQPNGSFKIRGIECACRYELSRGKTHLLSASIGNAGLAVAYVGYRLGVPTTVVLPDTTPQETVEKLQSMKAQVLVRGHGSCDEASAYCRSLCKEDPRYAFIHPFDHPKLWEGHATLVDEIVRQWDETPDLIICAVGGGGLMSGIVQGIERNGLKTDVLGVETFGADSLYQASEAKELITLPAITSIAGCLAAKCVAQQPLDYVLSGKAKPFRVTDRQAVAAMLRFADEARVLAEPGCAAALAPVLENMDVIAPYRNIVVEVCGGANVNLPLVEKWKADFGL